MGLGRLQWCSATLVGLLAPDGQLLTRDGLLLTRDGQLLTRDRQLLTHDGQLLTCDGQLLGYDGQLLGDDGQLLGDDGQLLGDDGQLLGGMHTSTPTFVSEAHMQARRQSARTQCTRVDYCMRTRAYNGAACMHGDTRAGPPASKRTLEHALWMYACSFMHARCMSGRIAHAWRRMHDKKCDEREQGVQLRHACVQMQTRRHGA
eukprot:357767-Chlamydomonas_euryale.AAC.4